MPKCRYRFFRYVLLLIEGVIKFVMRRGKELVPTAVVSTGNDENEYGKVAVERTMPFTSSSSDVMQATIRCNTDYQYQKRGVPDLSATEQLAGPASSEQVSAGQASFLMFGCRRTAGHQEYDKADSGKAAWARPDLNFCSRTPSNLYD